MQKAINLKVKASQKSSAMIWNLDAYCPKSYHLSANTSSNVQTQSSKNFFYFEEPKLKNLKSILLRDNILKPAKKKSEKKKRFWRPWQKHIKKRKK